MWQPNIQNVTHNIASHNLLRKAMHQVGLYFPAECLEDEHGVYAARFKQFILVAKEKPYGNIVSVHKRVIGSAIEHNVKILMYLDSSNQIYRIEPYEAIEKKIAENAKGNAVMINFPIECLKAVKM